MSNVNVSEFLDLQTASAPVQGAKESIFKSIYIGGTPRTENGIQLIPGKLQVKDVPELYNKDELHMVILYTKRILVKEKNTPQGKTLLCMSYLNTNPPKGTAHGPCGRTAAERAADPFCATCKSHLIVAGVLTQPNGTPIKDSDGELVFGFIRGRGVKYVPISDYVRSLTQMELPYRIFSEDQESFERSVANKMKIVTRIVPSTTNTKFGIKQIFKLEPGNIIPKEACLKYMNLAKTKLPDFDEKFDWSRQINNTNNNQDNNINNDENYNILSNDDDMEMVDDLDFNF
ncbi:MAG: hypothetical protein KatS3mg002_0219 [Candidatus Woesearchaeota archaeon]|nr:MAG: hypothetical protein KatS3mg002_0219 [Candidatus Woesearchaeota archaeon]